MLQERPDAAVVYYLLGDLSGLEGENLRESVDGQAVKLVLFATGENAEVRENALNNGVAIVALKSPDAAESVNLVSKKNSLKNNP